MVDLFCYMFGLLLINNGTTGFLCITLTVFNSIKMPNQFLMNNAYLIQVYTTHCFVFFNLDDVLPKSQHKKLYCAEQGSPTWCLGACPQGRYKLPVNFYLIGLQQGRQTKQLP